MQESPHQCLAENAIGFHPSSAPSRLSAPPNRHAPRRQTDVPHVGLEVVEGGKCFLA